jgi:hypothetical protein
MVQVMNAEQTPSHSFDQFQITVLQRYSPPMEKELQVLRSLPGDHLEIAAAMFLENGACGSRMCLTHLFNRTN